MACSLNVWCLALILVSLAILSPRQVHTLPDGSAGLDLTLEQVVPVQAARLGRGRSLLEAITTVKGLPNRFTIRPVVDPTLCVHRVNLDSAAVVSARARSNLPPTPAEEIEEYGAARLVLLPCVQGRTDLFLAEAVLGRWYGNNGVNYRQGFLKPPSDNGICVYGVNASYTNGHPVFGVTGTAYYEEHGATDNATKEAVHTNVEEYYASNEMDWFDDYTFEYAPYIRYGYDPASMVTTGTFRPPNPLPVTMLDASGWGPFRSSWGPCMRNPTLDSQVPTDDPSSELQLRYSSWIPIDASATHSISHLPARLRRNTFALLTLGPDRPQPDMSPDAGVVDAGELSADMGGTDRPYGNGYSSLVSKELCMTVEHVRAGAEVRLAQCNPVAPTITQVFQLLSIARAKKLQAALG